MDDIEDLEACWSQPMTVAVVGTSDPGQQAIAEALLSGDGHTVMQTGAPTDAAGSVLPPGEVAAWAAVAMATIDTSDAVFVVNPNGGVPQEVAAQVIYAAVRGKAIRYLVPLPVVG